MNLGENIESILKRRLTTRKALPNENVPTPPNLKIIRKLILTSLWSAEAAVPRPSGSTERRTSKRANTDVGKSLNDSATERL